ncbi:hypothetical protein ACHWQZ_G007448 [Mnemiopsis leidyi]
MDSEGFIYTRKKPKDTASHTAWRCQKSRPPKECPAHAYLTLEDNLLSLGAKPHCHTADPSFPGKRKSIKSLKRKAAKQPHGHYSEHHLRRSWGCLFWSESDPTYYDGKMRRDVRVLAFSTDRNMKTLSA